MDLSIQNEWIRFIENAGKVQCLPKRYKIAGLELAIQKRLVKDFWVKQLSAILYLFDTRSFLKLNFKLKTFFKSHHPYFFFSKVTDIYNPINQRSICDIETLKKRIHDQSVQFSNRYGVQESLDILSRTGSAFLGFPSGQN